MFGRKRKQKLYKLRKLTTKNATNDAYGITIPSRVAESFDGVLFTVEESGTSIVLTSGGHI